MSKWYLYYDRTGKLQKIPPNNTPKNEFISIGHVNTIDYIKYPKYNMDYNMSILKDIDGYEYKQTYIYYNEWGELCFTLKSLEEDAPADEYFSIGFYNKMKDIEKLVEYDPEYDRSLKVPKDV